LFLSLFISGILWDKLGANIPFIIAFLSSISLSGIIVVLLKNEYN